MSNFDISDEAARMRLRNLLFAKHLPEFAAFCEGAGWVRQEIRGAHEVLRMKKEGVKGLLIVHSRDAKWKPEMNSGQGGFTEPMHLTTWGYSGTMAKRFYQARRLAGKKSGNRF